MKKLLILALALLVCGAFVASAAAEDMAYTGWVADEACAKTSPRPATKSTWAAPPGA